MPSEETGKPRYAWREDKKLSASQEATWRRVSVEAQGRLLLALCAHLGRQSGQSGPDVARNLTDRETALQVMDSAGFGARQLAETWKAAEPVQFSRGSSSNPWTGPDHDPRVDWALTHGASDAELARIRAEVTEEHAQRAMEAEARRREYYGLDTPRAALGVSEGPAGPVQHSVVHADVPELGSA